MKQSQHFLENAENCAQMQSGRRMNLPITATSGWRPLGEP
jgi:hypothetical protein